MAERFTWTAIYHELAIKLLSWRHRQRDLIEFLERPCSTLDIRLALWKGEAWEVILEIGDSHLASSAVRFS